MKVGIVGATGAVGEEIIKVLEDRKVRVDVLKLFASSRSSGKVVSTFVGDIPIEVFSVKACAGLDVVFLAVSGTFALEYARDIAAQGCLVIDNSSAFRLDANVPLVIPEINGHTAKGHKLIANPNCTTAIALMALYPLHCRYGLASLVVSTYQAASGAGAEGMQELQDQATSYVQKKPLSSNVFAYPLLFNLIPHIDVFLLNGYTKEEMKVVWETRKILNCPDLPISCTAVRVPTLRAHAESITVETIHPVTPEGAFQCLSVASGVDLVDEPEKKRYPMPLSASRKENVEVGRIRQSLVHQEYGLDLFVCGDQLLRGAALNAVLIAEFVAIGDFKPKDASPPKKNFLLNLLPAKKTPLLLSIASSILAFGLGFACQSHMKKLHS